MMRLSAMWTEAQTVGADGRSPIADRLLEGWDHDPDSARFFRASANVVYALHRQGERCFLRFAAGSERTRDAIAAEVALVEWLAEAGLSVARPLRSRRGDLVETIETDLGTMQAVVFAGLDGVQPDLEGLDGARFHAWGAALGRLHAAMRTYPGADLAARPTWRDHLAFVRMHIPAGKPAVAGELAAVAAALDTLPIGDETVGPIHGDFELDNLCWREDAVGILDFDDCARSWYVADIAFALRDLFDAEAGLDHPAVDAFVRGYAAHHPLAADILPAVPIFSRMARLMTYARIARALDLANDRDRDYPEWLTTLAGRLAQRMATYEATLVVISR